MDIKRPRRILALGGTDSGVLYLLKDLTGSSPDQTEAETTAGLSHSWEIRNKYYNARIPIWIDEIRDVEAWSSEFRKPEAKEVLSVLGAIIFCFRRPVDQRDFELVRKSLKGIQGVITHGYGWSWEGVCLAVAMPQTSTPWLERKFEDLEEELGREFGFEYIDSEMKGRTDLEKETDSECDEETTGIERLREALEANEWEDDGGEVDFDLEEDEAESESERSGDATEGSSRRRGKAGFQTEADELQLEMLGMHAAVVEGARDMGTDGEDEEDEEGEDQVEQLDIAMAKIMAIRENVTGMSHAQRQKAAAGAVRDVMRMTSKSSKTSRGAEESGEP